MQPLRRRSARTRPSAARASDPIAPARRRTRALLDAAATHGAKLAFISSFTTLPRPDPGLRDLESHWRRQAYPYFAVKEVMETMVLDAASTGLPAAIVNPTACLGPWEHRGASSTFVGLVVSQRLPFVMRQMINVIDVRDVARALLDAVDAERYGVPIALSGHDIALDELARRLSELAGVRAPVPADSRLAALFAFWTESALALAGRDAPDVLRAVPLIAECRAMGPGSEQLALGVAVRPLEDTLRDAVQWHRSLGCGR